MSSRACWRAISAVSIPGNPTVIAQNMPGAASLAATNHLYNTAAKDGTVIARDPARHAARQDRQPQGREVRDRQAQLDRQPQHRDGPRRRDGDGAASDREGPARHGVGRRRAGGQRSGDLAGALQRAARHEIQDRRRLSRLQRGDTGDGARRGGGLGRLGHLEPAGGSADVAAGGQGPHPDAGRAQEASRSAERAAADGVREERRRPPGARTLLHAEDDGAADRDAAWRAGRAHGDPARAFEALAKDEAFLADAQRTKQDIDIVPGAEVDKIVASVAATPPEVAARLNEATAKK